MHKLKTIRAKLNFTQKEVAAGIGCSQGNVANYEAGQSMPVPVAQRLLDFAGRNGLAITLDQIYGLAPISELDSPTTQEPSHG